MPTEILAWADSLRRKHFPPERNRLRAHVMLFHALPPWTEAELMHLLATLTKAPPPRASVTGIMKLGGGTALALHSPAMIQIHAEIADHMHGLLTRQDAQSLRLHITVQNKVRAKDARALQAELAGTVAMKEFVFTGLELHAWEQGPWRPLRRFAFRR